MTPLSTAALLSDFADVAVPIRQSSILADALDAVASSRIEDLAPPSPSEAYTRRVLLDTPELLVIAARWRADAQTDLHGHSDSSGLYRVVYGQLEEERYLPHGRELSYSTSLLAAGDESYLPKGSFHQLKAREDSVTIHAYSPRPDDSVSAVTSSEQAKIDFARMQQNAG